MLKKAKVKVNGKVKGNVKANAPTQFNKQFVVPPYLQLAMMSAGGQLQAPIQRSIYVLYRKSLKSLLKAGLQHSLYHWQVEKLTHEESPWICMEAAVGTMHFVFLSEATKKEVGHNGLLNETSYAQARELVGQVLCRMRMKNPGKWKIEFIDVSREALLGSLVGIEMASYDYFPQGEMPELSLHYVGKKVPAAQWSKILLKARALGNSINLARHHVNIPAAWKTPLAYAQGLAQVFKGKKHVQFTLWDAQKCEREKMGLLLAVGQGSQEKPCMVHVRYRPPGKKGQQRPVAFVGKGVTFDTGGLDLKPSSNMRLMKKDMGGAAGIMALAHYVAEMGLEVPCDFYVGLAENSIDAQSMRPGDILQARNGKMIEIHNTDAEGRLVMADVLDVAINQEGAEAPALVIDMATLTGAIKAGLGSEVAGLFASDDRLAQQLLQSAQLSGDYVWHMPLVPQMRKRMSSDVADLTNAVDGFGGAITAALFLECFVGKVPWAHLDIYAWVDKGAGPFLRSGGKGQGVQCLAFFLENWMQKKNKGK